MKILAYILLLLLGAGAIHQIVTIPPAPPKVPDVPTVFAVPEVPALTIYDMPTGNVPVPTTPYRSINRSVSLDELAERGLMTGVYTGTPYWTERKQWFNENFYATLAARKVWHEGTSPETHKRGGPITWDYQPIPQYIPPPCDQAQPTGYDADGCRYVAGLFKDIEAKNPQRAQELREQVRRGRDVWYKGTFGNQDENYLHQSRVVGVENMNYPWLDTRTRPYRFSKWGLINDPDCVQGDASTNWYDKCQDPHSSGVLGYRKYYADPIKDEKGQVIYDPTTAPYEEDEIAKNKRFVIGHPCVQCHVGFDPTNPPENPNQPKWEHLTATIGNQHIVQPDAFFHGAPTNSPARQILKGGRIGTIDTSLVASDWIHNPGTQNNIMDFHNKRLFEHEMKDPVTGKISKAKTRHVLKGGEDSVGEHLALIRVYVNIGLCTEECWVPNFPYPSRYVGRGVNQSPMRIMQCASECDAWNYADAKMDDLAAFLMTGGPTYLLAAKDVDGTPGQAHIDTSVIPEGRKVFARDCATCHSTKVAPMNIRSDKEALARFYHGHVFGSEEYWQLEYTDAERNDPQFIANFMAKDKQGKLRPRQFAENGIFGQDWLGNDERTPFSVIGTNMCRAMHNNHNKGNIWEEFSSETYKNSESPGSIARVLNRKIPLLGGKQLGSRKVEGGPGYLRNISLLSVWATAPFMHNNAIGEVTYLADGAPDFTVKGRIEQFENSFAELMLSDDPKVSPSRPQKTLVTTEDMHITPREDMQGYPKIKVKAGTPVATFASVNPHRPLFVTCDDPVENRGHQFGVDLSDQEKYALREFLKLM